jgi:hypothetical protein
MGEHIIVCQVLLPKKCCWALQLLIKYCTVVALLLFCCSTAGVLLMYCLVSYTRLHVPY